MYQDRLTFGTWLAAVGFAAVLAGVLVSVLASPVVPRPRNDFVASRSDQVAAEDGGSRAPKEDRANVQAPIDRQPAAAAASSVAVVLPAQQVVLPVQQVVDQNKVDPAPTADPETSTLPVTTSATFPSNYKPARRTDAIARQNAAASRGLVILQLGDSHTSADFFSGEVRQRLQQRYGNGGAGYIVAGKPHIGVRTSALKVTASAGWTYQAIQKSDNISQFWLAGFNAIASAAGETLTFSTENPVIFDSIEIEALRQPGGGTFDIVLDGIVKSSFDLNAKGIEPVVLRLSPEGVPSDRVRKIEIRSQDAGTVNIASVAVFNRQSGVSYTNIGYPGASVDILNKFDSNLMADDLRRLNPQIVVLAFGTNEASNKFLDPDRYRKNYEKALNRITSILPDAKVVLVGPPDGAERPSGCASKPQPSILCKPSAPENASAAPVPDTATPQETDCRWHSLPKLEAVRSVVRDIAEQRGFTYWNWASIQPRECGAQAWVSASPPLMTPDHVHFTIAGYNKSAEQFLNALTPVIEKVQVAAGGPQAAKPSRTTANP
jgi:lysophospholipase L1-like esterase